MSRLFFHFFYSFICLLTLLLSTYVLASDVYVYVDEHGRQQFTDLKPDSEHTIKSIELQNEYDWADAPRFKPSKKKSKRKRKRAKKQTSYTLTELKTKCHAARGKYNNFRGTNKNIDWDTYRSRLERYKARRDKWCSRLLRGK